MFLAKVLTRRQCALKGRRRGEQRPRCRQGSRQRLGRGRGAPRWRPRGGSVRLRGWAAGRWLWSPWAPRCPGPEEGAWRFPGVCFPVSSPPCGSERYRDLPGRAGLASAFPFPSPAQQGGRGWSYFFPFLLVVTERRRKAAPSPQLRYSGRELISAQRGRAEGLSLRGCFNPCAHTSGVSEVIA